MSMTSNASPGSRLRFPERGIAALRIVVGLWFAKSILTKIDIVWIGGALPVPGASGRWNRVMPMLLTRYAEGNPIDGYKQFLLETVIPNANVFASLTALGEAVVGLGITLGLFTTLASGIGLLLVTMYGLATFWQGQSQQGFHVLLATCFLVFIFVRAGRYWGLDGWIREHRPHSWLAKLPLG